MNPNTPAQNQREYDTKIREITKCGTNMGSHDYIPISWMMTESSKHVSKLMCRVCFVQISIQTILHEFPDLSIRYS